MNLLVIFLLFTQLSQKQQELEQLKAKLNEARQEIKRLEKEKIGTLARIEKIDETINLTVEYIDKLTAQENLERRKANAQFLQSLQVVLEKLLLIYHLLKEIDRVSIGDNHFSLILCSVDSLYTNCNLVLDENFFHPTSKFDSSASFPDEFY